MARWADLDDGHDHNDGGDGGGDDGDDNYDDDYIYVMMKCHAPVFSQYETPVDVQVIH